MKVYRVSAEKFDWDEFDAAVVLADSREEVLGMLKHDEDSGATEVVCDGQEVKQVYFYDSQGEIKIEEVTTKGVVLASFNAG